jgi:hypothetical protein
MSDEDPDILPSKISFQDDIVLTFLEDEEIFIESTMILLYEQKYLIQE